MQDSRVGTEESDLALALRMADRADALTLEAFTGEAITFADKNDGSPVTETDLAVETALLDMVRHSRREDGFLGEETGLTNDGPRVWIVDPIDGTKSFVAGDRAWETLIALSEDGRLVVGVATAPAVGSRWWATAESSGWVSGNGQAIHELRVASTSELDRARWVCQPSIETLTTAHRRLVQPLVERCGPPINRTTHGALMVAGGEADICLQLSGGPWDFAALAVIVREAGGSFSYLDGSQSLRATGRAAFSNGALHPLVLAAMSAAP